MSAALFVSYHLLTYVPGIASIPIPNSSLPNIPFENLTALNDDIAPRWVPSANSRGTADLLYSCAITLTLCVYTAIHLNIPGPGELKWEQYARKAKWAAIGIFAPEVVLFTAWQQFWSARKLCGKLNALDEEQKQERETTAGPNQTKNPTTVQDASSAPPFDLVYGFYAVMGGLVVDVSDMHHQFKYFTLTPEGVLDLAKQGHFFAMSERGIKDKSKADVLAKGLVCFQVTWMLVQCIARKASGYPISLLELHTFVHVICALMMYALWFKKPLDVNEPTVVDSSAFRDVLAAHLITGRVMDQELTFAISSRLIHVNELERRRWNEKDLFFLKLVCPKRTPAHPDDLDASIELGNIAHQITVCVEPPGSEVVMKLRTGQNLENGLSPGALYGYFPSDGSPPTYLTKRSNLWSTEETVIFPLEINLTRKALLRWERAGNAIFQDGPAVLRISGHIWQRSWNFPYGKSGSFDPFSSSNLQNQWTLAMVLIMLLFAYGGVHLFAWNFGFPSSLERLLWRIAGLYLVGAGALGTCLFFARNPIEDYLDAVDLKWGDEYPSRDKLRTRLAYCVRCCCSGWLLMFAALLVGLLELGYLLSRFYIVVESFRSVKHLPIGVYAAVPWANYIPHF